jgi:hypothetical protein
MKKKTTGFWPMRNDSGNLYDYFLVQVQIPQLNSLLLHQLGNHVLEHLTLTLKVNQMKGLCKGGDHMSTADMEKIRKAKAVMEKIANGKNPITGEEIVGDHFLHDPRMIRCFFFVSQVLDEVAKGNFSKNTRQQRFVMTAEEKARVEFRDELIGMSEFAKCVNQQVDVLKTRKANAKTINKALKTRGILTDKVTEDNKRQTVTNEKSAEYGFEMTTRTYEGKQYEQLVMNDTGKRFLMEHLEELMNQE